jgi:hypothetical protein
LYTGLEPGERLVVYSPTYQIIDEIGNKKLLGFRPDWCFKVTVHIDVLSNCPAGNYVVALDMKNPATAVNQEFNWVYSGAPYYAFYNQAIREWRPVCPFFQVVISVM